MKIIRGLIGLFAILAVACFFLYSLESNVDYEEESSSWERPVYKGGHWILEGIVERGVETRTFSWGQADLVMARYGKGTLWAIAGLTDAEGHFFSQVDGIGNREDLPKAFRHPQSVIFSIKGTERGTSLDRCDGTGESICQAIISIEKGNPAPGHSPNVSLQRIFQARRMTQVKRLVPIPFRKILMTFYLVTGVEEQKFTSQSNVFIRTGAFPSHYQFGISTWRIGLGEINEQGLEGF